ncbi:xanthine dehydrogenase YagR molybdenum-binding subunit [Rhizobium sp. NFR07]|uniref:xanthine dehydrogenase family protein molybdopterin-binding subunit n=1 Tax=Rhizobium sp. NFR07 TaxID=1566262 RepID=UPI0008E4D90F|nr:xanthine dehydrogenase family protein molybdopterin-binding subunit [Rhizobium sp. NFR07]SFA77004.1 xanthine dehydrogenase YagR molybdenum-binding subunit [Rhizobium sp. NFR07]
MSRNFYPELVRVDACDKVRGITRFGTDNRPENLAHGAFAVATIGKGRVLSVDTLSAEALPGVLSVITHRDTTSLKPAQFLMAGGYAFQTHSPILTAEVAYRGQPVALVLAETLEIAIEAAALLRIDYEEVAFAATMDSPLAEPVAQAQAPMRYPLEDVSVGDALSAYEGGAVKVDSTYGMERQFQNPMELIGTVASWDGDRLTIHEGTQNAGGCKFGVADQLGISPENVTVISPFIGGGFGQKNSMQSQLVLAAFASRQLGRPVKIVVPRRQLFHDTTSRPATRQRVRLAADREGRLVGALYDVDAQTSKLDFFPAEHADTAARFYGYPAFKSFTRLIRTDIPTPGYMRAPFEHAAAFAIESAMDELSYQLKMDPVELRLRNDTAVDVVSGLPHSSRHVAECLRRGAETFGWSRRNPKPRSMVAANGDLIGMGVAIGLYSGSGGPTRARIIARRDGTVTVNVGIHEMGQGAVTAIINVVAKRLGVQPSAVTAMVGDTSGVPQPLTAGSWGSTSAMPAVEAVCDALMQALAEAGVETSGNVPLGEMVARTGRDEIQTDASSVAPGQDPQVLGRTDTGRVAPAGPVYPGFVTYSYAVHFVEVHVEASTGRIRVPRVVSMFDCGRVLSPRTARSQAIGGVVWGIGGTLREGAETDARYGGVMNGDIAEYLIPVNADIGSIEVGFIDEPDFQVNRSGVKGLGEVVMAGVAPAITNAVYHATETRVRDLPVRLEMLLRSQE